MQSIANISNISIYVHLHATEKCTSWRVLWDAFCKKFKTQIKIKSIYMTNKLVTITVIGPFCFTSTEARWLFRDGHNSHVRVPLYTLQALNTETCLNCLWWQAWWSVTKRLRATWTLSWNIQTKATGDFEKDTFISIIQQQFIQDSYDFKQQQKRRAL